jgi:hypothetical protein
MVLLVGDTVGRSGAKVGCLRSLSNRWRRAIDARIVSLHGPR